MQFTVEGAPEGKQRPRSRHLGNFTMAYTGAKTRAYEALIALEWKKSGEEQIAKDVPIAVAIKAFFQVPKRTPKKKIAGLIGTYCTKKPDADNIAKVVLDALNGKAYKDDAQVAQIHVVKMYGLEPKIMVEILPMENKG